jgi:hypothetical protein
VRIVAYNQGSTTAVGNAEYKVVNTGGGIEPVASVGLTVPGTGNYDFVAYSLSSTSVAPAYSTSTITVSPDDDLLWGKELNVPVLAGGNDITIKMFHKFSLVTVRASSASITPTAAISDMANVVISPSYTASLNVATGAMGTSGAAVEYALPSSFTGTSTLVANVAHTVFTHTSSPVSIKIGSVKVGVATYSGKTATFAMPLVEGKKYTLVVDFKRNLVWAGSNVYWNGSKMTFDAPTTDVDTQRKQGLFFKRGSLIGFTPIHDWATATSTAYRPVYTSATVHSWARGSVGGSSWNNSPVSRGGDLSSCTEDDWKNYQGDICRYISENGYGPGGATNKYRMPTHPELADKDYYLVSSGVWETTGSVAEGAANDQGTYLLNSYFSSGGVVFPLSGCLNQYHTTSARIEDVGTRAQYAAGNTESALFFHPNGDVARGAMSGGQVCARPIRCVRAN